MFVLAGYYWTQNVGDMALRQAASELLSDRLETNLWAGHLGEWFYQPGGPCWDEVEGLVLPGGGLLQDLGGWDPQGWGKTSTPAVFWASVMVEAAAHGVPVVAWANGFGPFEHHDALEFARAAYEVTSYCSWRDEASARLAGGGGPVTADLALTCGIELSAAPDAPLAVVLRPFPRESAPDEVVAAVGALVVELGRPSVVLPFEPADAEHTEALAQVPGAELVEPDLSWEEKIQALERCSGVVTNRFHAAMWGLAAGAPVVALPTDDSKLLSAVEMFGSRVRVSTDAARDPKLLLKAWRAAEAEISGGGSQVRRRRSADLAARVREEADVVVEVLRSRARPVRVDPVVKVLVSSVRARAAEHGEQREQANRLATEVRTLGQELAKQRDAADEQVQALRAEITATADVADDLYRQLRETHTSTAWKAAAPIRALGGARRRSSLLLPYVNARRVRAAVKLAMRGDLDTLRQRLGATSAVAGAAHGDDLRGRKVVRRPAEPWPVDQPLVSVVIPCFNYGAYVDEAIHSVLAQTLGPRVELIVVDGGSTDEYTQARMAELAASPPPGTHVLLRTDGRHLVGDNRNYGIVHATGRYVACLDADDRLHPNYLEVATFLLERYGYDVVSTATKCFGNVDDTFGLLPEPELRDMVLANNVTTAAVFRRELWERSGGYRDTGLGAEHVHEDWRLWLRMSAMGARMHNIVGQELFFYRVHSNESLSNHGASNPELQRERVQELNSDVLTPEAYERSAQGRTVEVVVEGALDNLWMDRDDRPGVLLCLPFTIVGGAERLLSEVVSHLVRTGYRVVVVTTLATDRAFGDTTEWFTDAGADVFHLPRLLAPHRWHDFFDHLIRNKGMDVLLLAGSEFTYDLLPSLRERHPKLRVVDLLFNTVGHTANNRRHAPLIDLHLCENTEVEQWLLAREETRDRVIRVESGIDLEVYQPRNRSVSLPLRIGFSGRLSEEKDPLFFIDLAEAARDPKLEFVMTGAGPLERKVRARVARTKDAVKFIGVVDDISSHVAGLDVLVVPSKADGRPLAVLEALALGVPVLACSVGGLPTLVEHGENGWLVDPGDLPGFVAVLKGLAEDPQDLVRMRRSARAFAEANLDVTTMREQYESALRRVLER